MATSDLKTLLDEQRAQAQSASQVDWSQRREKWLNVLRTLFDQIESWLHDAGLPDTDIRRGEREIVEETLGRYIAPTMTVQLPNHTVIDFTPIASVIIGGYGRVDVTAQRGLQKYYLIAIDADEGNRPQGAPSYTRNWVWRIFEPGNPRKSINFDVTGLTELLAKLSG